MFDTLLKIGEKHTEQAAYLMGLTVDVCIRLKPSKKNQYLPPGKMLVDNVKASILQFFSRSILGATDDVSRSSLVCCNLMREAQVNPRRRMLSKTSSYTLLTYRTFREAFSPPSSNLWARAQPPPLQARGFSSLTLVLLTSSNVAATTFFQIYPHQVPDDAVGRLQTPVLNCLKSSNADIREAASVLFSSLVNKASDSQLSSACGDITTMLKGGKTTGPDHRIALYNSLAALKPTSDASLIIVVTSLPLLAKESNDAVMASIEAAIIPHLVFVTRQGVVLPADVTTLLSKELNGLKVNVRRSLSNVIGQMFWRVGDDSSAPDNATKALDAIAKSAAPALQAYLKTVSATPLNPPGGVRQGYVAVAILLKWAHLPSFKDVVAKNAVIQSIPTASGKPSFLLWDKVYQKIADPTEDEWLVRATARSIIHFRDELSKSDAAR